MITKYFTYVSFTDETTTYNPKITGSEIIDLSVEIYGNTHFLVNANTERDILEFVSRQNLNLNIQEIDSNTFKLQTKQTAQAKFKKNIVRNTIRNIKDIEDDLTDQKILIQSLAVFCTELYTNVLTEEQRGQLISNVPNFDSKINILSKLCSNSRVLVMTDEKFNNIVEDELVFNNTVTDIYTNKRD